MTGKGILHSWTYDITGYDTSLFVLKVSKPWHVWNWMRFVPEGFKCWKLIPSVDDYGIVAPSPSFLGWGVTLELINVSFIGVI